MKKRFVASGLTLGLLLLGGGGPGSAASAGAGAAAKVNVVDNAFQPRTMRVQKGTRVRWTHQGSNPHTVTSNTGLFDKSLSPGDTFARRFTKRGKYPYHCEIHDGMTGVIKVVA
jgi:plastocyanin